MRGFEFVRHLRYSTINIATIMLFVRSTLSCYPQTWRFFGHILHAALTLVFYRRGAKSCTNVQNPTLLLGQVDTYTPLMCQKPTRSFVTPWSRVLLESRPLLDTLHQCT